MSPKEWPAEKLVSECLAQKRPAWDELVRRFGPVVHGTIRKHLSRFGYAARMDLAQDAYQEVFLSLSRDRVLGRLTEIEALPGYLAAVAISKTVDAVRSAAREGSFVEWTAEPRAGEPAAGDLVCPQPNPREEAERKTLKDIVESEIGDLPGREALVVRLKWQHDMSLEGIARQMELPVGTVATVLRRTREKVRSRLKEKGIEG